MKSKSKKIKGMIALGLAIFVASAGIINSMQEAEPAGALPEALPAAEQVVAMPAEEIVITSAPEEAQKKLKGKRSESFLCLAVQTIGYAICTALTVVLRSLGQPLLVKTLFWIGIALFALLAAYMGLKAAFPELSVKELMTSKRIVLVFLGVALAAAISELLPMYYDMGEWMLYIRLAAVLLAGLAVTEIIYGRLEGTPVLAEA